MSSFDSNNTTYALYEWQVAALKKWKTTGRGIIQATTGSGKSRVAHARIVEFLKQPDSLVSVIVPQVSLLTQWAEALDEMLGFEVGRMGGGKKSWSDRINVMVVNTAVKVLPTKTLPEDHLIIADECHRMAAPSFQKLFQNPHSECMGLSATPEREDTGLEVLREIIGDVVYQYGYAEALEAGVIAEFEVCAVQIPLLPAEQRQHDLAHQKIVNLTKRLSSRYGSRGNLVITCQKLLASGTSDGDVGGFLMAIQERKEILNSARNRFAALNLLLHQHKESKIMVFHESIDGISELEKKFAHLNPLIYHSKKTPKERRIALEDFSQNAQGLLLSCKALVEGVDIPDADVGIMVSGTRSVRSRIQTIGRLLRKGGANAPIIYLFYIPETSDTKSVTNLLNNKFPVERMRFMRYNPDQQNIRDTQVNVATLLTKNKPYRPPTPQTCPKCERTFKSKVGLNSHHCFTYDPDMTFDKFLAGFTKKGR